MINFVDFKRLFQKVAARISRKNSYALNALDLKLLQYINFEYGFFIEVGANDGINQSNTLLLEKKLNWNGLLIEAIPSLAEKCAINRPRCIVDNYALVSSIYTHDYVEMRYCNLMSVVKGGLGSQSEEDSHINSGKKFLKSGEQVYVVAVPTATLSEVLDKHSISHVDLLSLDVEGYEV